MRREINVEIDESEASENAAAVAKKAQKESAGYEALSMLLKAAIVAGIIILININYPTIVILSALPLQLSTLFTQPFLVDFVVVFAVLTLYDLLVERKGLLYGELIGGLAAGVVLATGSYSLFQTSLPQVFALSLMLFIAFLISFLLGIAVKRYAVLKLVLMAFIFFLAIELFLNHISGGFGSNGILPSNFSITRQNIPQNTIINYTLSLINQDRNQYGLPNVTLSPETSGQQHSDSMLQYGYFSHWDPFGMKPYMRYTLVGGNGAVTENVAYVYYSLGIDPEKAIKQMEYNMMYNDSKCCNNGHRDNIINPEHNQVSIGVAYSGTTIYLTEDFINHYITWTGSTPNYDNGVMFLQGNLAPGFGIYSVEVVYDKPQVPMSVAQLDNTSDYSYGSAIAGVVSNPRYYYPNLTTITANEYSVNSNSFTISFDMSKLVQSHGAGEYTVQVWLTDPRTNANFVASTYTVFINSNGQEYTPGSV